MSIEDKRKRRAKRKAKKTKWQEAKFYARHNSQCDEKKTVTTNSLTHDEKVKIIAIANEVGRQWVWKLPEDCMVEVPNLNHDEYTMELLEMDMAFIGRKLKNLDFDGWLFAILAEKGGAKWAATIFSRLNKDATGRHWVSYRLNPEFLLQFDRGDL